MRRQNDANQHIYPSGYGNDMNSTAYELSDEYLDEEELRLLQQHHYLQQKQLEQEQQELELYELQLQKQLAQHRLVEQQRLIQIENHRRQLHVARQQQQQQQRQQFQRQHQEEQLQQQLRRQHPQELQRQQQQQFQRQHQHQQQLILQRQLQQQHGFDLSPQVPTNIIQGGISQLSLEDNNSLYNDNIEAECGSMHSYTLMLENSLQNNQQNQILLNSNLQDQGNLVRSDHIQPRSNLNAVGLDDMHRGSRLLQMTEFENSSQSSHLQKVFAASSPIQRNRAHSGNSELDISSRRNQLPVQPRNSVHVGRAELDNSLEGRLFSSSSRRTGNITSIKTSSLDSNNSGTKGFNTANREIDHVSNRSHMSSPAFSTNALQVTDQSTVSNSNMIFRRDIQKMAPSSTASDNVQQSHAITGMKAGTILEQASVAPTLSATENPNDLWLPADYEPTNLDICSGRGKAFWNHSGNVAFRNLIQSQVEVYINAPTKAEKSAIVVAIVDELRRQGCKFLKQEKAPNGEMVWNDIGDAFAREKVGHSLRDQVTALNRSSNHSGSRPMSPSSFSSKPVSVVSLNNPNEVRLKSPLRPTSSAKGDDASRKSSDMQSFADESSIPLTVTSAPLTVTSADIEINRIISEKSARSRELPATPLAGHRNENPQSDLSASQHTSRTSAQQRSALLLEEPDDDQQNGLPKSSLHTESSTITSIDEDGMCDNNIIESEETNKMMKFSSPVSKFEMRGDSADLIMGSIQTIDYGGISGPLRASTRMSSAFHTSGSIMKEQFSEMSLLDSNMSAMSIQDFSSFSDTSFFGPMDHSRLEI